MRLLGVICRRSDAVILRCAFCVPRSASRGHASRGHNRRSRSLFGVPCCRCQHRTWQYRRAVRARRAALVDLVPDNCGRRFVALRRPVGDHGQIDELRSAVEHLRPATLGPNQLDKPTHRVVGDRRFCGSASLRAGDGCQRPSSMCWSGTLDVAVSDLATVARSTSPRSPWAMTSDSNPSRPLDLPRTQST